MSVVAFGPGGGRARRRTAPRLAQARMLRYVRNTARGAGMRVVGLGQSAVVRAGTHRVKAAALRSINDLRLPRGNTADARRERGAYAQHLRGARARERAAGNRVVGHRVYRRDARGRFA